MNTENKSPAGNNIIIGEANPLDIETLLGTFWAATKAEDRDGSVSIGAGLLSRMAKELILYKSSENSPVNVRSDEREMKPMPGHAYAITTRPYAF